MVTKKQKYFFPTLLAWFMFVASQTLAADRVVVIPLNSSKKTTGDAVASDVLEGKTFSNADDTGLVGTRSLVPVAQTGQTISWETGDDADLKKGIALPSPRFTNNGDGTVTDNLTKLVWLKNANCFETRDWPTALTDSNGLANGSCGLTDGSVAGDWRLPNRRELESLINISYHWPAMSNTAGTGIWTEGNPFSGVVLNYYWSSSPLTLNEGAAWYVDLSIGGVVYTNKGESYNVWPVRGGQ